jgi:hypothetical protein
VTYRLASDRALEPAFTLTVGRRVRVVGSGALGGEVGRVVCNYGKTLGITNLYGVELDVGGTANIYESHLEAE